MTAWEDEIAKYEKETRHSIPDDVKIAVMMKETKGHLQEHLRLQAGNLRSFWDVKSTIMEYFRSKQVFSEPVPMQVGANYWRSSKGKGSPKGKGKGFKGK